MDNVKKYSLALDFHENTKKTIINGNYDHNISYKIYLDTKTVKINENELNAKQQSKDSFVDVLLMRRSIRNFSKKGISLNDLSKLLSLSSGHRFNGETFPARTYASAGGRYPIELYAIVLRSDDVELGIYHYNVFDNTLELVKSGDYSNDVKAFYRNQKEYIDLSFPCLIVMSMVFNRSMGKYGEKGYRFALMDSGHISQNLYLVAEYLKLGIVALGGGAENDTKLDELLSLVSDEENAFYGLAVGCIIDK